MPIQVQEPVGRDLPWGTINCQHVQQKMEWQLYMQMIVVKSIYDNFEKSLASPWIWSRFPPYTIILRVFRVSAAYSLI